MGITLEESKELTGRYGARDVEDLLLWIIKQTDREGRAIMLDPTRVMVDEMFELGRSEWVRRHIAKMQAR
jgi:hypothetical protein